MTKKQELNNLIPKIKSQVKQWRGKISTDVQNQIFEVINELVAAQDKIAELEKDRDVEVLKKEHAFKRERYLIDENLELRQKTFRFYNDEEYWIFQDDGEDYADSLVCPVVMSAEQFRRLLNLELNIEAHTLEQQDKGIEFAIDAGIDFQQIENDVAVCNAIRTRAKAKALKEGKQ
jgi:hypothetical protein